MSNRSSHPLLSRADGIATGMTDTLLLIGRILVAGVFLMTVWTGSPNVGYLKGINFVSPEIMSPIALTVEWVIVVLLVLGLATRYGALLGLAFALVATISAHRYWGYPPAAQLVQFIFLTKNVSIIGGLIILFVTGGGRYSVDEKLKG
jgi:putative oxidoreductase